MLYSSRGAELLNEILAETAVLSISQGEAHRFALV
jgi:hypothetical protein